MKRIATMVVLLAVAVAGLGQPLMILELPNLDMVPIAHERPTPSVEITAEMLAKMDAFDPWRDLVDQVRKELERKIVRAGLTVTPIAGMDQECYLCCFPCPIVPSQQCCETCYRSWIAATSPFR